MEKNRNNLFKNFVCFHFIAIPCRFSVLKVVLKVELTLHGQPILFFKSKNKMPIYCFIDQRNYK